MKKLLIIQLVAAVLLAPFCFAEPREFTSSDGSKTMWADVTAYDAGTGVVTLRLSTGRALNAPATAFSAEDQEFIKKAAVAIAAGRYLAVSFADQEEMVDSKKNSGKGYEALKLKSGFGMEFRNNGKANFSGLTADYQIFYKTHVDPVKSRDCQDQVAKGTLQIPELEPRAETVVNTEGVDLTRIKQLPRGECPGST